MNEPVKDRSDELHPQQNNSTDNSEQFRKAIQDVEDAVSDLNKTKDTFITEFERILIEIKKDDSFDRIIEIYKHLSELNKTIKECYTISDGFLLLDRIKVEYLARLDDIIEKLDSLHKVSLDNLQKLRSYRSQMQLSFKLVADDTISPTPDENEFPSKVVDVDVFQSKVSSSEVEFEKASEPGFSGSDIPPSAIELPSVEPEEHTAIERIKAPEHSDDLSFLIQSQEDIIFPKLYMDIDNEYANIFANLENDDKVKQALNDFNLRLNLLNRLLSVSDGIKSVVLKNYQLGAVVDTIFYFKDTLAQSYSDGGLESCLESIKNDWFKYIYHMFYSILPEAYESSKSNIHEYNSVIKYVFVIFPLFIRTIIFKAFDLDLVLPSIGSSIHNFKDLNILNRFYTDNSDRIDTISAVHLAGLSGSTIYIPPQVDILIEV